MRRSIGRRNLAPIINIRVLVAKMAKSKIKSERTIQRDIQRAESAGCGRRSSFSGFDRKARRIRINAWPRVNAGVRGTGLRPTPLP